jgi:hypothetical protein
MHSRALQRRFTCFACVVVQGFVGTAWGTLVDLRTNDLRLLYLANGDGAPIGVNSGGAFNEANPEPSEAAADLHSSEISGVPGISKGVTQEIYVAMLQVCGAMRASR